MYMRLFTTSLLLLSALSLSVFANETESDSTEYYSHTIKEVTIICNPKIESKLFEMPGSITLLSERSIQELNIGSIKDISTLATNVYIPEYGSRLITSAYIRGIGSRINSPAIGLSVNNLPYLDKSAYDFDLLDVARIEVLKGPQGTLYGRNTMSGLINIYTHSPLDKQGTRISLGGGNYKLWSISAQTSQKINNDLALSVAARYEDHDGYFTNQYTGKSSGKTYSTSGRMQLDWQSSERVRMSLSADFEHSYQDGYPYAAYDKTTGTMGHIAYNDPSSYLRNLITTGFKMEYKHDDFLLTSTTGYQYLDDHMRMDQDFTPRSIFTLEQKQRLHAITQEVALRSTGNKNWGWTAGIFGSYQDLDVDAPVNFLDDGINLLIEGASNNALAAAKLQNPQMPDITIDINNNNLYIEGKYNTPTYTLAAFGQIEAKRIFGSNFYAALGARYEYERIGLTYDTYVEELFNGTATIAMGPMQIPIPFNSMLGFGGMSQHDAGEWLPKIELKYILDNKFMAYATVSKGYRSGGYNYQMFSNFIQSHMRTDMIIEIGENASKKIIEMMGDNSMSQNITSQINGILGKLVSNSEINFTDALYRPEHSWNYEIGVKGNCWQNRISADLSLFYIDCHDQQLSLVDGFGRITRNSGRTESYGIEASAQIMPINNLHLTAAYGYTHATFKDYKIGDIEYTGNYVPFAPMHSLAITGSYTWSWAKEHALTLAAQVIGRGGIYWTEANDVKQPFYSLLDATLTYNWKWLEVGIWGKNLTSTKYNTFYFETLNAEDLDTQNGFAQQGTPITFGANVTFRF